MSSRNATAEIAESYNRLYAQFSSKKLTEVGNYTIIKLIGEGAFGKVYLATHKLTHTKVVLKTGAKDDPNIVREVFYHRQFKHNHITRLYEVVQSEGMIWMVLEYCANGELYDYVLKKGRVPIDEVRKLFAQITSAVYYAHSLNCIHRDLKLENILLDKKNNAKLSDFGFTRECQQRSLLETICGTTVYMSPELIQKKKYDGFKADVWSLGIILFTMLYGHMPFDDDDDYKTQYEIVNQEPEYCLDVPDDAINLMKKLLNKSSSDRPSTFDILNDPFLENEGLIELEISNTLLKNLKNNKSFTSKNERYLLKKLKSLGIDVHALQKSVVHKNCDSLAGLWELLLEKQKKKEAKKHRKRSSRSVLRITESTSRRVSQFIDPITTPQLSRMVSSISNTTNFSFSEKPFRDSTPKNFQQINESQPSSPEKKKNGFIQKVQKLLKINKKENGNLSSSASFHTNQNGSSSQNLSINNKRSYSESHSYLPNNTAPFDNKAIATTNTVHLAVSPNINLKSEKVNRLPIPQKESNDRKLTIKEPTSPLRSGFSKIKGRSRPMSLISQYSHNSQLTGISDVSLDSNLTAESSLPVRPGFPRKISSDASLYSKNTTRRSLSLISSNSSASERSSRRSSFYDSNSASDLKFTTISTTRGRRQNDISIFPRSQAGFRRKKSPLGGLPPNSRYKRSKPLVIEEEGSEEDEEEVGDDELVAEDEDVDDLATDIEDMKLAESTRTDVEDEDGLYMNGNSHNNSI